MPEDTWGHLRDAINDWRVADPERPLARCLRCWRGVFIRAMLVGERRLPLFAHFNAAELECEWHSSRNLTLDAARAAQYQGQQESELHRRLCDTLAELLRADPRHRRSSVGTYHAPSEAAHGRFPDVYAELDGLPPITLELQLSRAFAPEIAARGRYYGREGVGLIWVLYGLGPDEEDLPQGFRDVIRRHRGNAFVFDQVAMKASVAASTLVLRCYLKKGDGSFYLPKLARLDDLTFPRTGLPFLRDTRTPLLLEPASEARRRWWAAFAAMEPRRGRAMFDAIEFVAAYDSLKHHVPEIIEWVRAEKETTRLAREHLFAVLAVLFSVARTAHSGEDRNLATCQTGMVNMMNTRLHAAEFAPYATLVEALLQGTAAARLLSSGSLRDHIAKAKEAAAQVLPDHPVWAAAAWMFPEVLQPVVRDELQSLDELPSWAQPQPSTVGRRSDLRPANVRPAAAPPSGAAPM